MGVTGGTPSPGFCIPGKGIFLMGDPILIPGGGRKIDKKTVDSTPEDEEKVDFSDFQKKTSVFRSFLTIFRLITA